jgi:signal transduction histidine kinase/CheY-like chemotaxis protein
VRSGCAFPVRSGERVVAIVEFFCEEAGEAQDQILEVFDHLGDQLGNVLERRRAEETLRQAQKMEAVGQLTGGLAHDFNNLLAVILGNLELIEDGTFGPDQVKPALRRAVRAAEQGADLTSRLLAFSRQQPLRPEPTDINRLITNFVELLQRTLGEHLWIRTDLKGKLWTAEIDRGQLEAALLNLAINARDAMPLGGRLLIETDNLDVGPDNREKRNNLKSGRYVVLSVSDTGPGIAQADLDKVFDPFFTTKETGGGSGLGLSMVYGFAKQSHGDAEIQSRQGLGTRVRLYLPATLEAAREPRANAPDAPAGAGETVLVVEDDAEVQALVVRMLTDSGYRAMAVDNAADGLKLVDEHDAIALLLTDMILPDGADGLDLAKRARARRPSLKTVLMSGYSDRFSAVSPADAGGLPLIAKPFRKAELAGIVRRTLDEADHSA